MFAAEEQKALVLKFEDKEYKFMIHEKDGNLEVELMNSEDYPLIEVNKVLGKASRFLSKTLKKEAMKLIKSSYHKFGKAFIDKPLFAHFFFNKEEVTVAVQSGEKENEIFFYPVIKNKKDNPNRVIARYEATKGLNEKPYKVILLKNEYDYFLKIPKKGDSTWPNDTCYESILLKVLIDFAREKLFKVSKLNKCLNFGW